MVVVGALEVVRDTMSIHLKVATRSALSVEEGNKIGKNDVSLYFFIKNEWHVINWNPKNLGFLIGNLQTPIWSMLFQFHHMTLNWPWNFLIFAIAPLKLWFKSSDLSIFLTGPWFSICSIWLLATIKILIVFQIDPWFWMILVLDFMRLLHFNHWYEIFQFGP